jgi:hypothetical protein
VIGVLWAVYGRGETDKGERLRGHTNVSASVKPHFLQSANYVRTELPVRIAHRLRDLQALPYVVVTQEGVAQVYEVCSNNTAS